MSEPPKLLLRRIKVRPVIKKTFHKSFIKNCPSGGVCFYTFLYVKKNDSRIAFLHPLLSLIPKWKVASFQWCELFSHLEIDKPSYAVCSSTLRVPDSLLA